jgi:methylmalonyl-CoA mutase C-terminal domain/subunit
MYRPIRVLIAKPGLDGHDRGAKVITLALRDAGFEVIYGGLHQTPEEIVNIAAQEDVALIGLSILSGVHLDLCKRLTDLMRQMKMEDVVVVVGGTISDEDAVKLKAMGIAAIFPVYSSLAEIVDTVKLLVGDPVAAA